MSIALRCASLFAELEAELRSAGRSGPVEVVAISKRQPAEAIREAVAAGIRAVGESYLQEAQAKFVGLGGVAIGKHFVGHVQTNKAKGIVAAFDLVQSVDRLEAATALARAAQNLGKRLPVLLQLNVSPSQRLGCPPERAQALADAIRALDGLRLEGVMAIGPVGDRETIVRSFELAAKTLGCVGGSTLSIGMSGDWREAVRAGSTMLRLGTQLFGPRTA